MKEPIVLYEDNHLLVVNKPAGIASAGVSEAPSVYSWAGEYIKRKYHKPGNVYVGIVSRLDTVTSGVLVLARTSKAASRLSEQIRAQRVEKIYLAVLEGHVPELDSTLWIDWVYKDDPAHRMRTEKPNPRENSDGSKKLQEAQLEVTSVQHFTSNHQAATLVSVRLLTGRKHQIRVQAASRGHAVWGDRKYGAGTKELVESTSFRGIALHSFKLTICHPTTKERLTFVAPLPRTWQQFTNLKMPPADAAS